MEPDGVIQVALKNLRDDHGDSIVAIADLCVDEYTDHGHCGVLTPQGEVNNDATLELYQNCVSPSRSKSGHGRSIWNDGWTSRSYPPST